MRIKSLLLSLGVLGSSTAALADWNGYRDARPARFEQRVRVERDVYRPRTTWMPLTSVERLGDRGARRGESFDIAARERFAQLRLQNQTGRSYVRQIEIVYANGESRCIEVNRVLDGNHDMVNIDLDSSRRIERIVVDGRSLRGGGVQLYAM
jgi:hypothetical protein